MHRGLRSIVTLTTSTLLIRFSTLRLQTFPMPKGKHFEVVLLAKGFIFKDYKFYSILKWSSLILFTSGMGHLKVEMFWCKNEE